MFFLVDAILNKYGIMYSCSKVCCKIKSIFAGNIKDLL